MPQVGGGESRGSELAGAAGAMTPAAAGACGLLDALEFPSDMLVAVEASIVG